MPRPERPLDASAGPVPSFAAALRKLRAEAGNPPYREMADVVHASKASLSAAASGHRLPTWEVTREYIRACGGDVEEWRQRWETARVESGRGIPTEPAPVSDGDAIQRRRGRRIRWRLISGCVAAFLIVVCTVVAIVISLHPSSGRPEASVVNAAIASSPAQSEPPPRFTGGGSEKIVDNADPKRSGCAADPTTLINLDKVEVNTRNENLLGTLVLRHSPLCHASWGRFEPSDRLRYLHGPTKITIIARRPATGTVGTPYSTAFDGQAAFGNILLDTTGCVEVSVTVEAPEGGGTATTACK